MPCVSFAIIVAAPAQRLDEQRQPGRRVREGRGNLGALVVGAERDMVGSQPLDEVVDVAADLLERRLRVVAPVCAQKRDREVDADDAARAADRLQLLVVEVPRGPAERPGVRVRRDERRVRQPRHVEEAAPVQVREVDRGCRARCRRARAAAPTASDRGPCPATTGTRRARPPRTRSAATRRARASGGRARTTRRDPTGPARAARPPRGAGSPSRDRAGSRRRNARAAVRAAPAQRSARARHGAPRPARAAAAAAARRGPRSGREPGRPARRRRRSRLRTRPPAPARGRDCAAARRARAAAAGRCARRSPL